MFHPIQHSDFNQRTESSESVVKCDQGSATSGSVEYSLARPVFIGNSLRSAGCCGSSSVGHWLATQQHGRRHPPQSYPKHFLFFFSFPFLILTIVWNERVVLPIERIRRESSDQSVNCCAMTITSVVLLLLFTIVYQLCCICYLKDSFSRVRSQLPRSNLLQWLILWYYSITQLCNVLCKTISSSP